jgi:hypothetical protein
VGRQRQEGLRGGERVTLGVVRAVRREAQRLGHRGQLAQARIALPALDAKRPPQHGRVDHPARQGITERPKARTEKRPLHPRGVRDRDAAAQGGHERRQRLRRRRSRGQVGGAQAVDLH